MKKFNNVITDLVKFVTGLHLQSILNSEHEQKD